MRKHAPLLPALLLSCLCLFCIAPVLAADAVPLEFGRTANGTIGLAGEADNFTFTGHAGDWVFGRAAYGTGSPVQPIIKVFGPDNVLLGTYLQRFDPGYGYFPSEFTLQLPQDGVYTILISDDNNQQTGDYSVFVQRTNEPGYATGIAYGDTISGTVTQPVELRTFTFAAEQGDSIYARLCTDIIYFPHVRLFAPNGTMLSKNSGSTTGKNPAEIGIEAPATGTYTLIAGEEYGRYTGTCMLHLQRADRPSNAAALGFGETRNATLDAMGEMDAYTFEGRAGDRVFGRVAPASLPPVIKVFGPDGALLGTYIRRYDSGSGFTFPPEFTLQLPLDGTYTVLVGDDDGLQTGDYGIFVQRTNDPGNAIGIDYGDSVVAPVTSGAKLHTYTFSAGQGDTVYTRLCIDFFYYAQLRLFAPNGTLLVKNSGMTGTAPSEIVFTAPVTGMYTLIAGEEYGRYTGTCMLHLQRADRPSNAAALGFGETRNATLDAMGEMDAYTFEGRAGDRVFGRAAKGLNSPVQPVIKVIGPDRVPRTYNAPYYHALSQYFPPEFTLELPQDGTYTILVGDNDGLQTGGYGVFVQRTNDPGNATGIAYGDSITASITQPAELHTYRFAAQLHDRINLRMTLGNSEYPQLRLYAQNGTLVASASSNPSSTRSELSITAPETGNYTLIAGDERSTYFGPYLLELSTWGPPGDLVPERLSFPAQVDSLEGLSVTRVVQNAGEGSIVVPWHDALYLSDDRLLDPADINLSNERMTMVLRSGQNYTATTVVHPPAPVPNGTHFLILKTDTSNAIQESREWNNLAVQPISVGSENAFTETASDRASLTADLRGQAGRISGTVNGDLTGSFNVTPFEIVTVASGSFGDQGFVTGVLTAELDDNTHTGDLQGVVYPDPGAGCIRLKGTIGGSEMTGIVDGELTESLEGSGVYDRLNATWRLNRIGSAHRSVVLDATGAVEYQPPTVFPSTALDLLQTTISGSVFGDYNEPLSITLNRLSVSDPGSPYFGKGFARISYVAQSGQGEGWAYVSSSGDGTEEIHGVFARPLAGIASGTIATEPPRTFVLAIERTDLGLPPAPAVLVRVWGPGRFSPGERITYTVEYGNDGLMNAVAVPIVLALPPSVNFLSSSGDGTYYGDTHEVIWTLPSVPTHAHGSLDVQVISRWGLVGSSAHTAYAYVPKEGVAGPAPPLSVELVSSAPDQVTVRLSDGSTSGLVTVNNSITHSEVPVTPSWDYWEDGSGVLMNWTYSIETHSYFWERIRTWFADNAVEVIDHAREAPEQVRQVRDANRALREHGRYLTWLVDNGLINEETRTNQIKTYENFRGMSVVRYIAQQLEHVPGAAPLVQWIDGIYLQGLDAAWQGACRVKLLEEVHRNLGAKHALGKLMEIPDGEAVWAHYLKHEVARTVPGAEDQALASATSIAFAARDPNAKYGPEGHVLQGQTLDYRIEFENVGEGTAYGVYIVDTLDSTLDASSLTIGPVHSTADGGVIAPAGTFDSRTRTITWQVGEVGPKNGGYANISVRLRTDVSDGTEVVNYGTVYFPSVPEETRTNSVVSIAGPNYPPEKPHDQSPEQHAAGLSAPVFLRWSGGDANGDRVRYDVYFGNSTSLELLTQDTFENATIPGNLDYGTEYFWKVVAKDPDGSGAEGDLWSFTTAPSGFLAFPGAAGPPTDTNADALYDDVNGNGRKDFADVVLYFNQMTWIAANEPVSAFDYNGNGRIDFADVVWLFNNL